MLNLITKYVFLETLKEYIFHFLTSYGYAIRLLNNLNVYLNRFSGKRIFITMRIYLKYTFSTRFTIW